MILLFVEIWIIILYQKYAKQLTSFITLNLTNLWNKFKSPAWRKDLRHCDIQLHKLKN